MFPGTLLCASVSSDLLGDGGSGVVGLGALVFVKALPSPSPSDERSRFSARGLMWFSSLVSVCLFVRCYRVNTTKCYDPHLSG